MSGWRILASQFALQGRDQNLYLWARSWILSQYADNHPLSLLRQGHREWDAEFLDFGKVKLYLHVLIYRAALQHLEKDDT